MKAVILAGGRSNLCHPLAAHCPRPLIPFCNEPMLKHQLLVLRDYGIQQVALALLREDVEPVSACFGDGSELGVQLTYTADPVPVGPAGALRALRAFIGVEPFVVLDSSTFLEKIGLEGLARVHRRRRATATLGIMRNHEAPRPSHLENVVLQPDGRVAFFEVPHASRNNHRHLFGGVYLFEAEVLEFIPPDGHADIKEQLIPELCARDAVVVTHSLEGWHARIDSTEEYERVQKHMLHEGHIAPNGYVRVGDEIWVGKETRIASSASVLGPVVIGRNCVVEDGARIIGPTVVGDDCRIQRNSLVRESILWPAAQCGSETRVEYSILGAGCKVQSGRRLRRKILMQEDSPARYRHAPYELAGGNGNGPRKRQILPARRPMERIKSLFRSTVKRLIDVCGSAFALVLGLPVFALLAALIKLDSSGPVFFVQRRCGRDGREFRMYKFRTMYVDAEKQQQQFRAQNSVDGPMFKMFDDPRRTRLGRVLHEVGLDELPQLFNVLRGDMSLVGPRPLVMDEMCRSPNWRDSRLSVKPGITGPWQISDRRECSFHDWIRHDVGYVQNWSLAGDLKILLTTLLWASVRIVNGSLPNRAGDVEQPNAHRNVKVHAAETAELVACGGVSREEQR